MIKSYVEHTAIRVRDYDWYLEFFAEVLGMQIRQENEEEKPRRQAWLFGGIQLIEDPAFAGHPDTGHLGIMTEDVEAVLQKAYSYAVEEMPQGHNWFRLPDGICIEVLGAKDKAVDEYLKITPWK